MSTNNPTLTPNPLSKGTDQKFRDVDSAHGMARRLDYCKSNIGGNIPPFPRSLTLPPDHRFDKTRAALQASCDNFIALYPEVWFYTLTIVDPINLQFILAGKKEFFTRLCTNFPDLHCVWVLAAHPRPHIHFIANLDIDVKVGLDQMENRCFGRHHIRKLTPDGYDYLARNLDKSRKYANRLTSARKWGVVKGRDVNAEVRVCVRSIQSRGPRAAIWAKHRHLFEPPNDAVLSVTYRDYIRRHYLVDDSVPDDEVDALIATRPACPHRRKRAASLKQFTHRLTWLAIDKFVGDRSPSEALAEAEAMTLAARAQVVAAPAPAPPMESTTPSPAPAGYTLAVTTVLDQFAVRTDMPLRMAVNLIPAPSGSPLRLFATGFKKGFATAAATTAACYLSVMLLTLLL